MVDNGISAAPSNVPLLLRAGTAVPRGAQRELPVVARLVVEIRSDGTATVARAGLSDELNGETTMLEARGATPLALALNLARHLVQLSLQGPRAARALLLGGSRRPSAE